MDGFRRSTQHPIREQYGTQGFQQQSGGTYKLITTVSEESMNLSAAVSNVFVNPEPGTSIDPADRVFVRHSGRDPAIRAGMTMLFDE